jgi:hypothetical protein
MAKSSTTFGANHQPARYRGKDKKTLILNAMKKQALLGMDKESTKDECEEALFGHLLNEALTSDDSSTRNACMSAIIDRGWSKLKPSAEPIAFDYDETATPLANVSSLLKQVSLGKIPPDTAKDLIGAIKDMIAINEHSELLERIKSIEEKLK